MPSLCKRAGKVVSAFHRTNAGPKRYAADQLALVQASEPALVPITVEQPGYPPGGCDEHRVGTLELTVGRAKLRVEGNVKRALLAQVLDGLLR